MLCVIIAHGSARILLSHLTFTIKLGHRLKPSLIEQMGVPAVCLMSLKGLGTCGERQSLKGLRHKQEEFDLQHSCPNLSMAAHTSDPSPQESKIGGCLSPIGLPV